MSFLGFLIACVGYRQKISIYPTYLEKKEIKRNIMEALAEGSLSDAQKEEMLDQFQQQMAIVNAQELLQSMAEKCFKKCISKPGTSLDGSEKKCLAMCMDRFMDSYEVVSKTYANRIQRESQHM